MARGAYTVALMAAGGVAFASHAVGPIWLSYAINFAVGAVRARYKMFIIVFLVILFVTGAIDIEKKLQEIVSGTLDNLVGVIITGISGEVLRRVQKDKAEKDDQDVEVIEDIIAEITPAVARRAFLGNDGLEAFRSMSKDELRSYMKIQFPDFRPTVQEMSSTGKLNQNYKSKTAMLKELGDRLGRDRE